MENPEETEGLIEKADKHVENKEYKKALQIYKQATSEGAKGAEIWYRMGDIYGQLKEDKKAKEAYKQAAILYDDLDKKCTALSRFAEYGDLIDSESCKSMKEECPDAWYKYGNNLYVLGRYKEALRIFEKVIMQTKSDKKYLTYAKASIGKGDVLSEFGQYKEASKAYKDAIKIYSKYSKPKSDSKIKLEYGKACNKRGVVLYHLRKWREMPDIYEKSIEILKPLCNEIPEARIEYARALNNMGIILRNFERLEEALENYEKSIDEFEELENTVKMKDDEVKKRIEKIVKEIENDEEVREEIKEIIKKSGTYEEIEKTKSMHALTWNNKGVTHYYLKEYGKAANAYEEAMEVNPGDSLAYTNLGYLLLDHGDYNTASKTLEKLPKIDKESAYILLLKGRIEIERENYDQAVRMFESAIHANLDGLAPLLWEGYARYIKAESYYDPKSKAYKGELFSVIREMERSRHVCGKHIDRELRECILYFLGYFYFKNRDIFTAKERLEECISLESRRTKFCEFITSGCVRNTFCKFWKSKWKSKMEKIWMFFKTTLFRSTSPTEKRARELLDHIWKYRINPPWYSWWLSSPLNHWLKRIVFVLLLLPIFNIFLEPVSFIMEHLSVYLLFVSISLLFLLLPKAEKIKAKEVEIELSAPPTYEPFLSPSMIEERIGDLEM
jgi:tetratricopeptide (TPR) repeat protein